MTIITFDQLSITVLVDLTIRLSICLFSYITFRTRQNVGPVDSGVESPMEIPTENPRRWHFAFPNSPDTVEQ